MAALVGPVQPRTPATDHEALISLPSSVKKALNRSHLTPIGALSLYSSLSAFDEDCDVVDDYSSHEFKFLVVSSC